MKNTPSQVEKYLHLLGKQKEDTLSKIELLDFKLNKDLKKLKKCSSESVGLLNIPDNQFLEKEICYYKREIAIQDKQISERNSKSLKELQKELEFK